MLISSKWILISPNCKPEVYYYEFIDFVVVNRISKTFIIHLKDGEASKHKYDILVPWEMFETDMTIIYSEESNQELTC